MLGRTLLRPSASAASKAVTTWRAAGSPIASHVTPPIQRSYGAPSASAARSSARKAGERGTPPSIARSTSDAFHSAHAASVTLAPSATKFLPRKPLNSEYAPYPTKLPGLPSVAAHRPAITLTPPSNIARQAQAAFHTASFERVSSDKDGSQHHQAKTMQPAQRRGPPTHPASSSSTPSFSLSSSVPGHVKASESPQAHHYVHSSYKSSSLPLHMPQPQAPKLNSTQIGDTIGNMYRGVMEGRWYKELL